MRLLTGSRPINSRSSFSSTSVTCDSREAASRSSPPSVITPSLGTLRRIGARGVLELAARHFTPLEREPRLHLGTPHDEGQAQRFAPERGIEGVELDVVARKG